VIGCDARAQVSSHFRASPQVTETLQTITTLTLGSGAAERLGATDQEHRDVAHHASVIVIAAVSGSPRTPT